MAHGRGGAIAAAWAILNYLGEEGYLALAKRVMETTRTLRAGIEAIEGIHVLGDPVMSLLAIGSDELDIYLVGDEMGIRGWHLDRQHFPASLHLTINFAHAEQADAFLTDLAAAVRAARRPNLRRLGNRLLLSVAQTATHLLPQKLVSRLTSQVSGMLGPDGEGMPRRSAPMYGMMGSLPNRGDLKEVVLDLVEQFTEPQA